MVAAIPPFDGENASALEKARTSQPGARLHVARHGTVEVAHHLASDPKNKIAFVNPSDREALTEGNLGQFWNGGHVAVEELLQGWEQQEEQEEEEEEGQCAPRSPQLKPGPEAMSFLTAT